MNKTQIQQLVVIVLLLVFVVTWFTTRKFSSQSNPAPSQVVAVQASSKNPAEPSQESRPPSAELSQQEPAMARDFFQLPALLKESVRQREQAREEAKKLKETKPTQTEGGILLPKEVPPSLASLQLQGIFWGRKPQVIINRQILSVGDKIEQAEVVSVTREGVTLSFNGQEFHLSLEESGKHFSGDKL